MRRLTEAQRNAIAELRRHYDAWVNENGENIEVLESVERLLATFPPASREALRKEGGE